MSHWPVRSVPAGSSVRLASDPALAGVTGSYFDANGRPTTWPRCAVDERNREAIWALCERFSGRSAPRARQ
jgi:hypothetical protein